MATVKSKALVDELIANNGRYATDPPVYSIVEYKDTNGETCWGLNYDRQDAYMESEYVNDPKTIFRKEAQPAWSDDLPPPGNPLSQAHVPPTTRGTPEQQEYAKFMLNVAINQAIRGVDVEVLMSRLDEVVSYYYGRK